MRAYVTVPPQLPVCSDTIKNINYRAIIAIIVRVYLNVVTVCVWKKVRVVFVCSVVCMVFRTGKKLERVYTRTR